MSLKNVVVADETLESESGSKIKFKWKATASADYKITTQPSVKVLCDGKKAYKGTITINVSNYADGTLVNGSTTATITGSSTKMKIENEPALLEGDQSSTLTILGQNAMTGLPASAQNILIIESAGQTKVKAE